jgi:prepilin-type N-terminal cleavage/methylation domain-containing protein/prepilin-type processing-associated H-X9-DG protein
VRQTSRAFTLVELLVVITIISVLASLLLPALTRAKYRAGDVACVRTLRQMGGALEMYAMTTDAYLPAAVPLQGQLGQPQSSSFTWNMLLAKLIFPTRNIVPLSDKGTEPPDRSFLCPLLVGRDENLRNVYAPAWDSAYRYNTSGVGPAFSTSWGLGGQFAGSIFIPTRESNIIAPSEMTALGDPLTRSPNSSRDGSYDPTVMEFRPQPAGGNVGGDARLVTNYRKHRNRYNRFFCDGHIEFEDCNKPYQDSDAYLARWNVDHLPHREGWRW